MRREFHRSTTQAARRRTGLEERRGEGGEEGTPEEEFIQSDGGVGPTEAAADETVDAARI